MNPLTIQTLSIGAFLFVVGLIGFLTRRNLILMFLSLELMMSGAAINFVAFSRETGNAQGQFFAILILTVASCEAALALALVVSLFRLKSTLDIQSWTTLHEVMPDRDTSINLGALDDTDSEKFPTLSPAGYDPLHKPASVIPHTNDLSIHETKTTRVNEYSAHQLTLK